MTVQELTALATKNAREKDKSKGSSVDSLTQTARQNAARMDTVKQRPSSIDWKTINAPASSTAKPSSVSAFPDYTSAPDRVSLYDLKTGTAKEKATESNIPMATAEPIDRQSFTSVNVPSIENSKLALFSKTIGQTYDALPYVIADTANQQGANARQEYAQAGYAELSKEHENLGKQLDAMVRYRDPKQTKEYILNTSGYKQLQNRLAEVNTQLSEMKITTPVSADSVGMQKMAEAQKTQEQFLSGMSPTGQFLGQTALSIGQNAVLLPAAALSPAIPLIGMSALSAADKMYDLNQQGYSPSESFGRGLTAGAIEAATEYLPLESLLSLVKTGGKSVIINLLKQAGIEATEEGVSYVANYMTDKASKDPSAEFNINDMLEQAAQGGLSGLFFGAGGSAVHYALNQNAGTAETGTVNQTVAEDQTTEPTRAEQAQTLQSESALVSTPYASTVDNALASLANQQEENNGVDAQPAAEAPESVKNTPVAASQKTSDATVNTKKTDISGVFGKVGTFAYNMISQNQQEDYKKFGEFARYYQAGMTGTDISKVKSVYSDAISAKYREMAYGAGKQDAAASLATEKAAVSTAVSYGNSSGLVRNQYSRTLNQRDASNLDAISKRVGVKIMMDAGTGAKGANGWIENGVIHIASDASNPVMVVATHEVTHRMQSLAPTEYRAFRDYAIQAIIEQSDDGSFNAVEWKRASYADAGVKLTEESAMDEIAADFAGQLMTDENAVRKLVGDNRTVAQKFFDAVKEFIKKVKGAFPGSKERQSTDAGKAYGMSMEQLEKASALWETALGEAENTAKQAQKNATGAGGAVRYSLKEYSEYQKENWANSKSIVIYKDEAQLSRFVQNAMDGYGLNKKMYFGAIPNDLASRILAETGVNVDGYNCTLRASEVNKIFKKHGTERTEAPRGQRAITVNDFLNIPLVVQAPDSISLSPSLFEGKPVIIFSKEINNKTTVVSYVSAKHLDLTVQTMYASAKKGSLATTPGGETPSRITSETLSGTASKNSISQDAEGNKTNFSLKDTGDLEKQVTRLKEMNDYLKEQMQVTGEVKTDRNAIDKLVSSLLREQLSVVNKESVTKDLTKLYDYLANPGASWVEAKRMALDISEQLVSNSRVLNDEQYRQYEDLRKYLRGQKLTISASDSSSISDFEEFRKRNFSRFTLSKNGVPVDTVYRELSDRWPEYFDADEQTHPADQLMRISDVLDGLKPVYENPNSGYLREAAEYVANDIIDRFYDTPQAKATFADKQAKKLNLQVIKDAKKLESLRESKNKRMEELRAVSKARLAETLRQERLRREKQVSGVKEYYQSKEQTGRERRSARELRAKIVRHASTLSQKLLRPSDKQHVPEALRQATAAALDAINRESTFTVDPDTGKRVKDGSGTPTKRTEAFRKLRLAYADITKDGGDYTLIIDPDLMDNLNELEAMRDTPLAEMGTQQLSTVWATLKAVEASIRTANTMLGISRFETISQFANGIRNDNIMRTDRGNFKGILGKMDKLANLDMLIPQAYFHRMGNTGEELFRMLRAAQDRHISIMYDAQQTTEKIVSKAGINKLERETHTFDIGGEKLTMSTAQIMSLYELMKREQAQEHILIGGIRPDAINTRQSLQENRRSAPVHIGIDGFSTITAVLTDEQIKMADGLQKYMGGAMAELGNKASMEVYGYRKFNEPDYFPIPVDKNQTKRDITKEAQAATIAGRGFTKSVAPKANNAVMVNSIFDVYSSHVNDMATYAAWLPTMENVRRIRDFTFRDGEGARVGDVKTIIERVFGKNGNAYLNRLVDDINQGIRPNGTGNLTDGIVGNYKAAAVAANIRVILQQPTAILRALDTLDAKYLLQGTVKRGDWEKVMKYAPIARWKDWGYFDINTGRQMKDVLLNSDTMLERVRQAGMAMAGKADSFAWARLWNAVEAETKDTRPGLKPGTDEFYKAVSVRFSEIVDRTQVVDGLLQRSQIMRSPDALTKMSTSFMAEPTKTYNMFANAVYDVRHADSKQARSRAKSALARTTAALVTSFAVNALKQSIVDAMRDDDKEKDYWEKLLLAYTGFSGDEETFLDYWNSFWTGNLEANFNPLSYLPYFKDLISIAQGYDVTRMDMEAVEKVWTAATNMKKALTGEGKYTLPGATANLMAEAARMLGLPVANLKRDVQAAAITAAIETDNYLMQYRIDSALLNMGYSGNSGNFMDILYNASINDPEAYEIIYADMVKHGVEEDKIRTAMESRMKRDQGAESVKDLEARYLTPTQEKSYSGLHGKISGATVWTSASAEQREAMEGDLYDLTVGNTAGEKLQEKIDSGSAYGISETDYLLYRLAQDVASEDGNNNTSQEEAEAAIEMLSGLSSEAKAYLWQSTNKGWKESGNPFK